MDGPWACCQSGVVDVRFIALQATPPSFAYPDQGKEAAPEEAAGASTQGPNRNRWREPEPAGCHGR
jgi:hypothetical protein